MGDGTWPHQRSHEPQPQRWSFYSSLPLQHSHQSISFLKLDVVAAVEPYSLTRTQWNPWYGSHLWRSCTSSPSVCLSSSYNLLLKCLIQIDFHQIRSWGAEREDKHTGSLFMSALTLWKQSPAALIGHKKGCFFSHHFTPGSGFQILRLLSTPTLSVTSCCLVVVVFFFCFFLIFLRGDSKENPASCARRRFVSSHVWWVRGRSNHTGLRNDFLISVWSHGRLMNASGLLRREPQRWAEIQRFLRDPIISPPIRRCPSCSFLLQYLFSHHKVLQLVTREV